MEVCRGNVAMITHDDDDDDDDDDIYIKESTKS